MHAHGYDVYRHAQTPAYVYDDERYCGCKIGGHTYRCILLHSAYNAFGTNDASYIVCSYVAHTYLNTHIHLLITNTNIHLHIPNTNPSPFYLYNTSYIL